MKHKLLPFALLFLFIINGCKKDTDEVDTTYPVIDITASDAFPKQCSSIRRGETFTFRATFSDNQALGSSSIDIHHNFDHHTHSTEVTDCTLGAVKTPVNPFVLIRTFTLPAGQTTYTINEQITVPADVDPGDYHFMIRLTDQAGWQSMRGLSIKII